jgi:GNAT superfamily N-acetyltransferase
MEFTIQPVTRQEEAYATAYILGDQLAVKNIDVGETPTVGNVAKRLAQEVLCNPRFAMFGAYRPDGAAMGYICGEVRPSIYVENQVCGYELLWVVADQYRKFGVGLALLTTWEEYCKKQGCKHVYMGLSAHTSPETLRRIYAGRGYTLHSESYSKTF